jgi:hypothetical protein
VVVDGANWDSEKNTDFKAYVEKKIPALAKG